LAVLNFAVYIASTGVTCPLPFRVYAPLVACSVDLSQLPVQILGKVCCHVLSQLEFFCRPAFALSEIRHDEMSWRAVGRIKPQMCQRIIHCPRKVLSLLDQPLYFSCPAEETCYNFLRRFIEDISEDELGQFLRFCTGASVCVTQLTLRLLSITPLKVYLVTQLPTHVALSYTCLRHTYREFK